MSRAGSLARLDDDLTEALTEWALMIEESRQPAGWRRPTGADLKLLVDRYVFHVELTFGDVPRPNIADLGNPRPPVVTYVFAGTLVNEEAVSVAGVGGLNRQQYEIVVHAATRRAAAAADPLHEQGAIEQADLLAGLLRQKKFRVTFQPEGGSRDAGEHTVGIFAERG